MSRKALTPEQLGRLCKCAPAIMDVLDLIASELLKEQRVPASYAVLQLMKYIKDDGELPKCFAPDKYDEDDEDSNSTEQSESKEECTLTPQQKYADELFKALELCVKDSEAMAELLKLKPQEWNNRYPTQKALIEKIRAQLA